MTRPSRATAAGRAYNDLARKARSEGRLLSELLTLYALEGFLGRLSESDADRDTFVLKGGMLLAAYETRRPTKDADLLAEDLGMDAEIVRTRIAAIAKRTRDDGLALSTLPMRAVVIRDEDEYTGVRISLEYQLASARIPFHVDVNVGDPVWPEPQSLQVPGLLGGYLTLRGYPLVSVFAEKLVTAIQRGEANTRWRDFADVYLLSGSHTVYGVELEQAVDVVATFRVAARTPLSTLLPTYPSVAQGKWAVWRRKQSHADALPERFEDVLKAVCDFGDEALAGSDHAGIWNPTTRSWARLGGG